MDGGVFVSPAFESHLRGDGWSKQGVAAAALKFLLLSEGLRVSPPARARIYRQAGDPGRPAEPIRTRSGVSGGLDLILERTIFVNAPVKESFADLSSALLDWDGDYFVQVGSSRFPVSLVPRPSYYGRQLASGDLMEHIAQMCSADRLCYSLTGPTCSFWPEKQRCRYCSIGLNSDADSKRRRIGDLVEVASEAVSDASRPARHVLLGGGTPAVPDMGARLSSRITARLKEETSIPVYVMIAAPLRDEYIDELHAVGVDELGINLEFWEQDSWHKYIPGKESRIGRARYLDALRHAAEVFGPVRSRSILIAGLEPAESTLKAVRRLVDLGVMPIISPFRPLSDTDLQDRKGFEPEVYQDLYVAAASIAREQGLPIGPTCGPCKNNVLSLPEEPV
ncbi:radical SAM protein [Micromonospora chalcea]